MKTRWRRNNTLKRIIEEARDIGVFFEQGYLYELEICKTNSFLLQTRKILCYVNPDNINEIIFLNDCSDDAAIHFLECTKIYRVATNVEPIEDDKYTMNNILKNLLKEKENNHE